jgi:hypothetical protein
MLSYRKEMIVAIVFTRLTNSEEFCHNNIQTKNFLPGVIGMFDPGGRARCLVEVLRPVRGSVIMTRLVRLPLEGVGVLAVTVMLGSFPVALDMGRTTICTCVDMMPRKNKPLAFKVVCQ